MCPAQPCTGRVLWHCCTAPPWPAQFTACMPPTLVLMPACRSGNDDDGATRILLPSSGRDSGKSVPQTVRLGGFCTAHVSWRMLCTCLDVMSACLVHLTACQPVQHVAETGTSTQGGHANCKFFVSVVLVILSLTCWQMRLRCCTDIAGHDSCGPWHAPAALAYTCTAAGCEDWCAPVALVVQGCCWAVAALAECTG